MTTPITAAVLDRLDDTFRLQSLQLRPPGSKELLVKVVACGICHTDIKVSQGYGEVPLPVVLGHEGAGIVEQVGEGVSGFSAGDAVVMSFPSCGHCPQCQASHPAYCDAGQRLSFSCGHELDDTPYTPASIHGYFFGQSSFASHAIINVRNAVRVDRDLPLETLGPLGCGFQTGAGIVLNVLQPAPGQSLAVMGAGNVGLSAIMAARIAGMSPVIALDNNAARLALASELGATHVIDTGRDADPIATIQDLSAGGVNFAVDTTNIPALVRLAFAALANRGTCVHSGGGGKDLVFAGSHLLHGRTVTGVIQGDSVPGEFIPQLLEYHRAGQFPFGRLLSFYPLAEINQAIDDMKGGRVVKPVLIMP